MVIMVFTQTLTVTILEIFLGFVEQTTFEVSPLKLYAVLEIP